MTNDLGQNPSNEVNINELEGKKEAENEGKTGVGEIGEIGMSGKLAERFKKLFTRFHPFLAAHYFFGDRSLWLKTQCSSLDKSSNPLASQNQISIDSHDLQGNIAGSYQSALFADNQEKKPFQTKDLPFEAPIFGLHSLGPLYGENHNEYAMRSGRLGYLQKRHQSHLGFSQTRSSVVNLLKRRGLKKVHALRHPFVVQYLIGGLYLLHFWGH